jgi:hypothetical protein
MTIKRRNLMPKLIWTDHKPPSEKRYYTHLTADTPLGKVSIDWLDWVNVTSYEITFVDFNHMELLTDSLEEAKAKAEEFLLALADQIYETLKPND